MSGTAGDNKFDVLILGGGPGGARAAYILARAGKRVCLISNDMGGECLNYGCIPTKTYLWAAELYEKLNHAGELGLEIAGSVKLNWGALQKRKNDVVGKLKKGLRFKLDQAKVHIREGRGKLKDANTVEIQETGEAVIGDYIILATGSSASMLPGVEKNDRFLTNRELIDVQEIPKKLLIIGGGAVGVEFASLFNMFGSAVTIAEAADRLLPSEDDEISAELERIFIRRGIEVLKGVRIGADQTKEFDKVLVAVGRNPVVLPEMNQIGIVYDNHGVKTDNNLRTSVKNIFAIGDLAGKALTAYTAEREAEVAAGTILGRPSAAIQYDTVVNTIFCIPEVASAGAREQILKENNTAYTAGRSSFSANAKALIVGSRDGFAKILADKSSGKLLGIHIIGEKASEIIAEAGLALSADMTHEQFAKNIHSHPILGEVLREACDRLGN